MMRDLEALANRVRSVIASIKQKVKPALNNSEAGALASVIDDLEMGTAATQRAFDNLNAEIARLLQERTGFRTYVTDVITTFLFSATRSVAWMRFFESTPPFFQTWTALATSSSTYCGRLHLPPVMRPGFLVPHPTHPRRTVAPVGLRPPWCRHLGSPLHSLPCRTSLTLRRRRRRRQLRCAHLP